MSIQRNIEALENKLYFDTPLNLVEIEMVIEFSEIPHLRIRAFEQYKEEKVKWLNE